MATNPTYSISDLAREFDLTTRAIRFYEDMGLLQPQREGPGGRKTLELRVCDGTGGEPPSAGATADAEDVNASPAAPPPAAAVARAPSAGIAGGQGARKPDAAPAAEAGSTEQQMQALRQRIEQRRAQLRAEQARSADDPARKTDNP